MNEIFRDMRQTKADLFALIQKAEKLCDKIEGVDCKDKCPMFKGTKGCWLGQIVSTISDNEEKHLFYETIETDIKLGIVEVSIDP